MSGTGLKAPDWAIIPLCKLCHRKFHDGNIPELMELQAAMILLTIDSGVRLGVIKFGGPPEWD